MGLPFDLHSEQMNDSASVGVPHGPFPGVVPVLTDGRVRLRAMTEADLPFVVEQSTDPDSVRWTTVPRPYGLEDAREFLSTHSSEWALPRGKRYWAISPLDDPEAPPFAGVLDLRPGDRPELPWEVGFAIHPATRGRGLMSAALRLGARWAFEHGAPSLYWLAVRGNFASWRVAHACGFTHHGTLPSRAPARDGAADAWCASLLPDQPMEPQHPWVVPPVIETDGLRLRPLREDDTGIAEPHDHPTHHLPSGSVPTPETFEDWLLRRREQMSLGRSNNWCLADPESDDPLGEVLVFVHDGQLADGGTAELGYLIRPSARGRGLAVRAARAAAEHALRPVAEGGLGLRRLVAETAEDNVASNRVLEAAGFTVWGREAAADAPDGSVGPALHWERLA